MAKKPKAVIWTKVDKTLYLTKRVDGWYVMSMVEENWICLCPDGFTDLYNSSGPAARQRAGRFIREIEAERHEDGVQVE